MHRNKKYHLQHFSVCLVLKWEITIETLVLRYYIAQDVINCGR